MNWWILTYVWSTWSFSSEIYSLNLQRWEVGSKVLSFLDLYKSLIHCISQVRLKPKRRNIIRIIEWSFTLLLESHYTYWWLKCRRWCLTTYLYRSNFLESLNFNVLNTLLLHSFPFSLNNLVDELLDTKRIILILKVKVLVSFLRIILSTTNWRGITWINVT